MALSPDDINSDWEGAGNVVPAFIIVVAALFAARGIQLVILWFKPKKARALLIWKWICAAMTLFSIIFMRAPSFWSVAFFALLGYGFWRWTESFYLDGYQADD